MNAAHFLADHLQNPIKAGETVPSSSSLPEIISGPQWQAEGVDAIDRGDDLGQSPRPRQGGLRRRRSGSPLRSRGIGRGGQKRRPRALSRLGSSHAADAAGMMAI